LIVGLPGSGKTTALRNSGLGRLAVERFGDPGEQRAEAISYVEVWSSEQAVWVDTKGQLVLQENAESSDPEALAGWLDQLQRFRGHPPLNGVLVVIDIQDLRSPGDGASERLATLLGPRLRELDTRLGMHLPMYLLFTKADRLLGFSEFFDDLDLAQRAQVWGVTLPLDPARSTAAMATFAQEMDGLEQQINDRLLDRLQQETDLRRRELIYGFRGEFAALREPLGNLLGRLLKVSPGTPGVLLRGVFQ